MSTQQPQVDSQPSEARTTRQTWRELIDRPLVLLALLFFVTAAPGLPLLWMSRGFSVPSKIVLTILVLAWTALVLWAFYLVMAWCLPRIWESLQVQWG